MDQEIASMICEVLDKTSMYFEVTPRQIQHTNDNDVDIIYINKYIIGIFHCGILTQIQMEVLDTIGSRECNRWTIHLGPYDNDNHNNHNNHHQDFIWNYYHGGIR